jgi:hypothetical protein
VDLRAVRLLAHPILLKVGSQMAVRFSALRAELPLIIIIIIITNKQTPWPESANELYRPRDRRLLAKLLPTLADRGCHVVSVTDPNGRILGFTDLSPAFSFKYLFDCTQRG